MPKNLKNKIEELESKLIKSKIPSKNQISSFGIALEFSFSIIFCSYLGFYLDKYFTTNPILFIIFLLIGILAGLKNIFLKL
jgi:F0F1-type ATP synthase assembly protein I